MTTTTQSPDAARTEAMHQVALGDTHFLSEAYDQAERCYRAALEYVPPSTAELPEKLERAGAAAATRVAAGEMQREIFAAAFSRDQLLAGPAPGGVTETPPDLAVRRDRLHRLGHALQVRVGRGVGRIASSVFHRLTARAGARGTSGAVWTSWHSSGRRLPGEAGTAVQILKLAHMRETLFANNLVRPYPEGTKTAFVGRAGRATGVGAALAHRRRQLEQPQA